jgi:hypothetical protein
MYELILTVCSLVQGAECRELPSINIDRGPSVIACAMASQIEGAKYVEEHPNFYIHKMTCQPARGKTKA